MKIAVDAMGGDNAPKAIIDGVILAALEEKEDVSYVLVGREDVISSYLSNNPDYPKSRIEIVHASETIEMDESPVAAIKRKKDSSISKMVDLAKEKKVDAVVSAGNTGAVVVASTLKLRTLPGIDRPAIAAIMPRPNGYWILIDAGANAESKPKHLFQFSVMGEVFAKKIMEIEKPKVGLMSIGEEMAKGNELIKETHKYFEGVEELEYLGNIEGHDAFTDNVDVIVCDGFVGNVILKVSESVAGAINTIIKEEVKKKIWAPVVAPFFKSVFKGVKNRLDHEEYGGAPLIGIDGTCIIAHGNSSHIAIKNALNVAKKALKCQINDEITKQIKKYQK
ncbi:MAG: phosphate acyltransferase PlsX [Candidatus Aureabacteria bacterium]|nr:phosphate acyltransferase PlsX [Candidatus Auribacterota bacterium]